MERNDWVYRDRFYFLDSEQTHDAWVEDMRADGWRLWMPKQTWEGTRCTKDGRPALRHWLPRWAGPDPEPPPTWDPAEGPADWCALFGRQHPQPLLPVPSIDAAPGVLTGVPAPLPGVPEPACWFVAAVVLLEVGPWSLSPLLRSSERESWEGIGHGTRARTGRRIRCASLAQGGVTTMKRLHWRRISIVRPAGLLAVVAVVLAAGCGTGSPQPSATSPTTTRPSATSPSTTRTTTPPAAAVAVVPARVLRDAIATTGLGAAYKVTFSDVMEGAGPGGMDLSTMGDFVSGPPGCAAMFTPHSQTFRSAAFVLMETESAALAVQAESYGTPEQAKKVMAQNHEQAKSCTTFTMRVHVGEQHETATVLFGAISGSGGDTDPEWFAARFAARSGDVTYDIETYELRIGGEMLHLEFVPGDPKSATQTLQAHFEKVITTYRSTHPRPGDS